MPKRSFGIDLVAVPRNLIRTWIENYNFCGFDAPAINKASSVLMVFWADAKQDPVLQSFIETLEKYV